MKNSIKAKIPFFFKGVEQSPGTTLNLDDWAQRSEGELPDLSRIIAQENGISSYSYELEVMEVSEVVFEEPEGFAAMFFDADIGVFDFEGFKDYWLANQSFEQLNEICQRYFGQDLERESATHQALMAAFVAGKND